MLSTLNLQIHLAKMLHVTSFLSYNSNLCLLLVILLNLFNSSEPPAMYCQIYTAKVVQKCFSSGF